jgi:glycosyltransferase involved in cell wall biosynthesis
MARGERLHRLAGIPWARNMALTAQTVREHVVDDPVQLVLQASRRVPSSVSGPVAAALVRSGGWAGGVPGAIGHEMRGERAAALDMLHRHDGDRRAARSAAHRADAALGLGEPDLASELLGAVDPGERGATWYAAAARLAAYAGDHDGAVDLAAVHPRNHRLALRMAGERNAFSGRGPSLPSRPGYTPLPGRILHVLTNSLPHTGSGYAQRSHSILRSLAERGFTVRAVTRPGYPVQVGIPWASGQDVVDGIEYRRLVPWTMAQGLEARLEQHARLLAEQVEEFRPAVLHTTTHFTNALAVRAVARAYGIPWVYEVRGQLADTWAATRGPAALDSQRYRDFVAREAEAARDADGVVTLGAGMRASLEAAGVAADRLVVCPNAVGEQFLDQPPEQAAARRALGLDPEAQLVGTVSSIVDYEGLDVLVRAVARLAPRYPRLRLRIAGDGVSLPGLRVLAEELGISGRSDFPGRVQRSEAILHHAALDVFVVPRKDLPVTRSVTPMKSVESSAVGRPVVASDLPALAELVQDGVTGRLVPASDVERLAAVLAGLLDDPAERHRLGAAGRSWALSTRTWAGNAERYEQLYQRLGCGPADRAGS